MMVADENRRGCHRSRAIACLLPTIARLALPRVLSLRGTRPISVQGGGAGKYAGEIAPRQTGSAMQVFGPQAPSSYVPAALVPDELCTVGVKLIFMI